MYFVRYFRRQLTGLFWNLEAFENSEQALKYADIVGGSVFIKIDKDRFKPPRLVKIN